jgi:RNA-directed DNA polymerase
MEESDTEGLATHGGPESCAGVREGVGEALTGVRAGSAIEPRNQGSGVPTPLSEAEGNTVGSVSASSRRAPRGRRTGACTEPPCARTGRSDARPAWKVGRAAQGRPRPYA